MRHSDETAIVVTDENGEQAEYVPRVVYERVVVALEQRLREFKEKLIAAGLAE